MKKKLKNTRNLYFIRRAINRNEGSTVIIDTFFHREFKEHINRFTTRLHYLGRDGEIKRSQHITWSIPNGGTANLKYWIGRFKSIYK